MNIKNGEKIKRKRLGMNYSLNSPSSSVQKNGDFFSLLLSREEGSARMRPGWTPGLGDNRLYLLPRGFCGA